MASAALVHHGYLLTGDLLALALSFQFHIELFEHFSYFFLMWDRFHFLKKKKLYCFHIRVDDYDLTSSTIFQSRESNESL
uniref:Uncharacterized protein n=1 Tax=Gossypium raimondii TaxID=29730 RepID=A0A0D2P6P3_GOSRA|nr:hypothetical protein B456_004G045200 [Gossypium raimondii]